MGNTVFWEADDLSDGVGRAHSFRYYAARGFIEPGESVLDASCGCGAGTNILAQVAGEAIGIESSRANLTHAIAEHDQDNIQWYFGDLDQVPLPEVDSIVSIETIEHEADPARLVAEMQKKARRMIFATVPIGKTTDTDPTHKTDFMTENDFRSLFQDPNWVEYHSFVQGNHLAVIYRRI